MRVSISGHQMETGDALQSHAEEKIVALQTYVEGLKDAHIVFSQQNHHHHLHHAAVTAHAGGLALHAEGSGIDTYAALDDATAKLSRQLEKYKGRLAKHRERRQKFKEKLKDMGPLSLESLSMSDSHLEDVPHDMFADHAPEVVKKDVDKMSPMTVDEAVMQMDLLHKPAFLFLNVSSGQLNMVYREGEAQVRWVAPK
ncbi:MAG TPA: ribosome-associated translation inhibitor RaiA [Alphaproteobacteria bacterium]|nr:ribosome-associated translation inhibitor RaiA [Alphaproteobacteria bacterium]